MNAVALLCEDVGRDREGDSAEELAAFIVNRHNHRDDVFVQRFEIGHLGNSRGLGLFGSHKIIALRHVRRHVLHIRECTALINQAIALRLGIALFQNI
ncbi:hypothetical protein D1872_224090 [compost metagenome]